MKLKGTGSSMRDILLIWPTIEQVNIIPYVTNSINTNEGNRQVLKEVPFRIVTRFHTEATNKLIIMQNKSMALMMLEMMNNLERISSMKRTNLMIKL